MKRRDFCAGWFLLPMGVTACGGGSESTDATSNDAPLNVDWDIRTALAFVAGGSATIDLNDTLPDGVPRGGTFGMDPAGSPLPSGLTLTADGKLSAGTASVGLTTGVMFTYNPS